MKYRLRRILNKLTKGYWLKYKSLFNEKIVESIDGNDLEYILGTDIGNRLYFYGNFEKNELDLCKQYIEEGSTVIDIGANIGIHSIFFSKLATSGKVISFEPQTTIFDSLLKNVNKFENIIPVNLAINSEMKITEFYIARDNAYSSLKDTERKEIVSKKYVLSIPFDNLSDLFSSIDFIKIDVEGFESEVLISMKSTLVKYKPVLFVEIYGGKNSNLQPDSTVEFLIDLGYQAFYVDANGNLASYVKHDDKFYNYFFIYKD